jgi:hypothetical protein
MEVHVGKYKPSERAKNDAFERGQRHREEGKKFSPPEGDGLTDFVFAPLNALTGDHSSAEIAEGLSESYRQGYSNPRK